MVIGNGTWWSSASTSEESVAREGLAAGVIAEPMVTASRCSTWRGLKRHQRYTSESNILQPDVARVGLIGR
jgi:hypothetical protein